MIPDTIRRAKQRYQKAAEALMATVRAAYPIGSLVELHMGRGLIQAEVIRHNDHWWYHPDEVVVMNLRTMKERKFTAGSDLNLARVIKENSVEGRSLRKLWPKK